MEPSPSPTNSRPVTSGTSGSVIAAGVVAAGVGGVAVDVAIAAVGAGVVVLCVLWVVASIVVAEELAGSSSEQPAATMMITANAAIAVFQLVLRAFGRVLSWRGDSDCGDAGNMEGPSVFLCRGLLGRDHCIRIRLILKIR